MIEGPGLRRCRAIDGPGLCRSQDSAYVPRVTRARETLSYRMPRSLFIRFATIAYTTPCDGMWCICVDGIRFEILNLRRGFGRRGMPDRTEVRPERFRDCVYLVSGGSSVGRCVSACFRVRFLPCALPSLHVLRIQSGKPCPVCHSLCKVAYPAVSCVSAEAEGPRALIVGATRR